jgi:hypothetical protein
VAVTGWCGDDLKKEQKRQRLLLKQKIAYFIHTNFSSQGSNRAANFNKHKHKQHFLSYSPIKTYNNTQTIHIVTHLPNNNNTGRYDLFESDPLLRIIV